MYNASSLEGKDHYLTILLDLISEMNFQLSVRFMAEKWVNGWRNSVFVCACAEAMKSREFRFWQFRHIILIIFMVYIVDCKH